MCNINKNYEQKITYSLFGHSLILNKSVVRERLYNYLEDIVKNNKVRFLVGTHGDFDSIAFGVCRALKQKYYDNVEIYLVFTSDIRARKEVKEDEVEYYKGINIVTYDIEEAYFKRKIIDTNQKMVDESNVVVIYCGYNWAYSGARRIMQYAKKQHKTIINLFDDRDKL